MVSVESGEGARSNKNAHVSLQVSTSRKGLLSDEGPPTPRDFTEESTSFFTRLKLLKLNSRGNRASSSNGLIRLNSGIFRKIDWHLVRQMSKEWVRKPLNMAILLWITCVAVSGAILFLVMTGMLNRVLPKKSQKDMWFEVNNQIINALFTLMCLYQHPKRFHHLVLLCRWKPKDITQLRMIYCKNGTPKPNERAHIMVVVILLHINCFAQYALCGLNVGFKRSNRPVIGVAVCLSVAIAAPAIAGLYTMLSPLGKDYDCDADEEAPKHLRRRSLEKRFSFAPREELASVGSKPEWRGSLFHLWEDFRVAYFSIFCCFCVFGWNMERLGFGNMYVHIATFLLFCMAPFWIFNLAAVNVENDTVREILGITGIALCVLGLLYGGFWRIQMRKRFNLPPNSFCFWKPDFSDCFQWLFCWWCSLAQEVRTADFYDVVEDRLYRKQFSGNEYDGHTPLTPLPRENSAANQSMSDFDSSFWIDSTLSKLKLSKPRDENMIPPSPSTMKMKVDNLREI